MKNHPDRLKKLDNEYDWWVDWYDKHKTSFTKQSDDEKVRKACEKARRLTDKTIFEQEVFNVEITTFHFIVFSRLVAEWKLKRVAK
jgi:hypothetical protein